MEERLRPYLSRDDLTIEDLVEVADGLLRELAPKQSRYKVTERPDARTIRYYITQKLLPRPESYEGGRARYSGQHVARLLMIKKLTVPEAFRDRFKDFVNKNVEAFRAVRLIIHQMDELLVTGFGGAEAERVRQMVRDVARLEHEADRIQFDLLKSLVAQEQQLSVGSFFLWDKIFRQVSGLSNNSERLAHRIRRVLELK